MRLLPRIPAPIGTGVLIAIVVAVSMPGAGEEEDIRTVTLQSLREASACAGLPAPASGERGSGFEEVRIWRGFTPSRGPHDPSRTFRSTVRMTATSSGIEVDVYEFLWREETETAEEFEARRWMGLDSSYCAEENRCERVRSCRVKNETDLDWGRVWDYLLFLGVRDLVDASELPGFESWRRDPPTLAIETSFQGRARTVLFPRSVPDPVREHFRAWQIEEVGTKIEIKVEEPHSDRMQREYKRRKRRGKT